MVLPAAREIVPLLLLPWGLVIDALNYERAREHHFSLSTATNQQTKNSKSELGGKRCAKKDGGGARDVAGRQMRMDTFAKDEHSSDQSKET